MQRVKIKIAQSVSAASEVVQTFTPEAGHAVDISTFSGFCANSMNLTIQLLWKYNTGGEQIIWQFTGPGSMPFVHSILGADVNGTDSLAIKCKNIGVNAANMSAYADITEYE